MLRQILSHPVFRALAAVIIAVTVIHLFSALTRDRIIEYKQITVKSPKISPALEGYTAAFITDLHGSPEEVIGAIADELSILEADIILMGGDYAGQEDLPGVFKRLAEASPPDGIYGVQGNHDELGILREAMAESGAVLLENGGASPRPGLYIAGTEDIRKGTPDPGKAVSGAGEDDFILMLSHNPDTTMLYDYSKIDFTLSGHTHGGEIVLFGAWAPAMGFVSDYGQRFRSGWAESAAGTGVYVSNGVGKHSPLRVFSPPQVILITFEAE